MIYHASPEVRQEIELLVNGGTLEKPVHEEITYGEIHQSEDHLWNFLLFTGYLKVISMRMEGVFRLVTLKLPNDEVRYIYHQTISNWFQDEIKLQDLSVLYSAMLHGEAGNGRYDLCVYNLDETIPPVILELKHSEKFKDMEGDAKRALAQIEEKQYDAWLPDEGYTECIRYGIAFYKKKCRVQVNRKIFS